MNPVISQSTIAGLEMPGFVDFSNRSMEEVELILGTGDDVVTVANLDRSIVVRSGDGDDQVIANHAGSLASTQRLETLDAEFVQFNLTDSNTHSWVVEGNQLNQNGDFVVKTNEATISEYNLGDGIDDVIVNGNFDHKTRLNTRGGNDRITLGDRSDAVKTRIGSIESPLLVDGGMGTNSMVIDDWANLSNEIQGAFSAGAITGFGMDNNDDQTAPTDGRVEYANIDNLEFRAAENQSYRIFVADTSATTTLKLGIGDDLVTVADNSNLLTVNFGDGDDVMQLQGAGAQLDLRGGEGSDTFSLDFSDQVLPVNGSLVDASDGGLAVTGFANLAGAEISIRQFEEVGVELSQNSDNLTVDFAASDITQVSIGGGMGDDQITIENVGSPTNIAAGTGEDLVTVNLSGAPQASANLNSLLSFDPGLEKLVVDNSSHNGPVYWATSAGSLSANGEPILNINNLGQTQIRSGSGQNDLTIEENSGRVVDVSIQGNSIDVTSGEQVLTHQDFAQDRFTIELEGLSGVSDTASFGEYVYAVSPTADNLLIFKKFGTELRLVDRLLNGVDVPGNVFVDSTLVKVFGNTLAVNSGNAISLFSIDSNTGGLSFYDRFDSFASPVLDAFAIQQTSGVQIYTLHDNFIGRLEGSSSTIIPAQNGFDFAGARDIVVDASQRQAYLLLNQQVLALRLPFGQTDWVSRDSIRTNDTFDFNNIVSIETNSAGTHYYVLKSTRESIRLETTLEVYARDAQSTDWTLAGLPLRKIQTIPVSRSNIATSAQFGGADLHVTSNQKLLVADSLGNRISIYQINPDGQVQIVSNITRIPGETLNFVGRGAAFAGFRTTANGDPNLVYIQQGVHQYQIDITTNGIARSGIAANSLPQISLTNIDLGLPNAEGFELKGTINGNNVTFYNRQMIEVTIVAGYPIENVDLEFVSYLPGRYEFRVLIAGGNKFRSVYLSLEPAQGSTGLGLGSYPVIESTGQAFAPVPANATDLTLFKKAGRTFLAVAGGSTVTTIDATPRQPLDVIASQPLMIPTGTTTIPQGTIVDFETNADGTVFALLNTSSTSRNLTAVDLSGDFSSRIPRSNVRFNLGAQLQPADGFRLVSGVGNEFYLIGTENGGSVAGFDYSGGLISATRTTRDGDALPAPIDGLQSVVISPDGEFVYAVDPANNSLVIARVVIGQDGPALVPVNILVDQQSGNNFLGGASLLAMDASGSKLYVIASEDGRIVEYNRNSATGELAASGNRVNITGQTVSDLIVMANGQLAAIVGPTLNVMSPNGNLISSLNIGGGSSLAEDHLGRLLVTSPTTGIPGATDALRVFQQNGNSLIVVQSLGGLADAVDVWTDGELLFVAGNASNSLFVLKRNSNNDFELIQTLTDGENGVRGLGGANKVARSTNGQFVYVMGSSDDTLAVFRVEADQNLQFVQFQRNGNSPTLGLKDTNSIVVSPTSGAVIIGSTNGVGLRSGGLSIFSANEDAPAPASYSVGIEAGTATPWNSVTVNTSDRSDFVSVTEAPDSNLLNINTGDGDDFVDLASAAGSTTIETAGGNDVVELRSAEINDHVMVTTGDGLDEVNIRRTGLGGSTVINTGGDNDIVTAQGSQLESNVQLDGGNETDSLVFYAPENSASGTAAMPNGNVQVNGKGNLNYLSVESVSIIAPPAIVIAPINHIAEGDSLVVDARGTNTFGNPAEFLWDLNGDGVFGDRNGSEISLTWEELNSFGINDDGVYSIALRVVATTANGELTSESVVDVTVTDTAAVLSLASDTTADVGSPFRLNFSATDPGDDTITAWQITWGDGTVETYASDATSANHVYQTTGTYHISVAGTNEDGTSTKSTSVNISPVAPVAGNYLISEGESLELAAVAQGAPSAFEWDLNGDGNYSDASGSDVTVDWAMLESLGIIDNGMYAISLRVTYSDLCSHQTVGICRRADCH